MVTLEKALVSRSILVVDDKPNNLRLITQYLKEAKYKVLIVQTGARAIEVAKSLQPDLILLDVMMPGIDGFSVCRHLKESPQTKHIPIIFMTALTETKNKVQGFELGAVDYIAKPVIEAELLARVKTHLSLNHFYQTSLENATRRKLLYDISDRIRNSLDLEVILNTATQEISNLLDCDFVGLASLNQEQVTIEAYSSKNTTQVDLANFVSYQELCPSTEVLRAYLQQEIEVLELEQANKLKTRLILPILVEKTDYTSSFFAAGDNTFFTNKILYGWLLLERDHTFPWQSREISLLKELSIQLAIAIKQGLLHQQLSQLALLDSLTQVYNRRSFDRQLKREWGNLKRIPAPLSLIMCDVDCFKIYNDVYGHQEGDICLQQVAQAISSALKRLGDILARYGGEEFAVILPHTPESGAVKVAECIRQAVKELKIPHHNSLAGSVVTLSLGVASTIPNALDYPQLLIEAADLALYQAKERGRDCFAIYPESISRSKDRQELKVRWLQRLRNALEQNQFSLYAQSIQPLKETNLEYNSQRRFEILLRLTDCEDCVITPGVFIDIAERNFLMMDIDTWVINQLFQALEQCPRQALANCIFSINLSGASLSNESFLYFLQRKLQDSWLPASLFCFEITESIAVTNLNRVIDFITSLKKMGCSFALDDFGKGVSSLTYLKNLPVDYLKIDGSFIKELNVNPAAKVMVEAINHIAEGIGLKTVAEFVENENILNNVKDLNIDYAQGFHFGLPGALSETIERLSFC